MNAVTRTMIWIAGLLFAGQGLAGDANYDMGKGLVDTFFDGSVESAVAALLDLRSRRLDDEELDRIARRIEETRRREEDR